MDTAVGLVMAGAVIGIILTTRRLAEYNRTRRAFRGQPFDPSLPDGTQVRVTGVVRGGGATLTAPLSGRECVAYRSRMYLGSLFGRAERPREAAQMVSFEIERGDGSRVLIAGERVLTVDLPAITLPPDSARCYQFAVERAVASGDRNGARYEEVLVHDGMPVTVAGRMTKTGLAGDAMHPIAIGAPVRSSR